jgi:hypothetical protein
MLLAMGYGVYFFFASTMILSMVFVYFLVPETSNISLEAVDRVFDIWPVHKANATVLAEIRNETEALRHDMEHGDTKEADSAEHIEDKV